MTVPLHTVNALWVHAIADELARAGVRHAVISPGSRSTPLVLALSAHCSITDHSVIDERSAAFFALGLARATGAPVALVCTSGTAAANYLPAVCEADHARMPLIVLTADRPHWLRDSGAPQTTDQVHLYGSHVRWFFDAPDPAPIARVFRALRSAVSHAVAVACGSDAGPVHLNIPLDKPLEPVEDVPSEARVPEALAREGGEDVWGRTDGGPFIRMWRGEDAVSDELIDVLEHRIRRAPRVVLVAGPDAPVTVHGSYDDSSAAHGGASLRDAVRAFTEATGIPVLAEALSQVRFARNNPDGIIGASDLMLRNEHVRAMLDGALLLRIGGTATTSVAQRTYGNAAFAQIRIARHPDRIDAEHVIGTVVQADPAAALSALAARFSARPLARFDARWGAALAAVGRAASGMLEDALDSAPWSFEAPVYRALAHCLHDGDALVVSSSMPVRDLETFIPRLDRDVDVFSNRGVNGIDGVTSTAFGIARAREMHTVLVTGDIAFLHDIGALLTPGVRINCAIVVINNDGGEIFEMLPVAQFEPAHTRHFVTAHGRDLSHAVALYGHRHVLAATPELFAAAFTDWRMRGGISIIEVRTDLRSSRAMRSELFTKLGADLLSARPVPDTPVDVDAPPTMLTLQHIRPAHAVMRMQAPPAPPALLLHGFTRSGAMWHDAVRGLDRSVLVTDLPGHGSAPAPDVSTHPGAWSLDAAALAVIDMLECDGARRVHLAGYSMGGRVALRAAVLRPDLFASLALISSSPGIADAQKREERRALDESVAERILSHGLERFVDDWMRIPMFDAESRLAPEVLRRSRAERLRGTAAGYAASLRGMGQGTQEPQWDALPTLRMPVLLVAGALDSAYVTTMGRMRERIPEVRLETIPGAGHDVPTEAPDALRTLLAAFWSAHDDR